MQPAPFSRGSKPQNMNSTRQPKKMQTQSPQPWQSWSDTARYVLIRLALALAPIVAALILYVVIGR